MGQISYPVLNRFGYSMYWNNMWDSLHMYNRFFLKSLFLTSFFSDFFNFYLSLNFFFFSNFFEKNIKYVREKFKSEVLKIDLNRHRKINKFYEESVSEALSSRVHMMVFGNWWILIIFLYQSHIVLEEEEEEIPETPYLTHYLNKLFFLKNNFNYFYKINTLSRTSF